MKKRSIYSVVLIIFGYFSFVQAQDVSIDIEYLYHLGDNLEFGDSGFLLNPNAVTTDKKGNIFIADHSTRSVKMYSKFGDYIQEFGRRGRGPGEFNRLSDIAIDEKGRLLVLDRMSFKVARFNVYDRAVEEHFFKDMNEINMMTLVSLDDDRFAGIYLELGGLQEAPIDLKAIRVYKFGDGEKTSSHYKIFQHLFDKSKPIEERLGGGIGHKLTLLSDNKVAVGHVLYKGRLSIVNLTNNEVIDTKNPNIASPNYLIFKNKTREELTEKGVSNWMTTSGRSGIFRFQIFNYSQLLQGSNNLLFHIFDKNEPNGPMVSRHLEVYSQDGELIHVKTISNSFRVKESIRQRFLHIDNDLRLFVRNSYKNSDPEIHVYQLKLNGLEK